MALLDCITNISMAHARSGRIRVVRLVHYLTCMTAFTQSPGLSGGRACYAVKNCATGVLSHVSAKLPRIRSQHHRKLSTVRRKAVVVLLLLCILLFSGFGSPSFSCSSNLITLGRHLPATNRAGSPAQISLISPAPVASKEHPRPPTFRPLVTAPLHGQTPPTSSVSLEASPRTLPPQTPTITTSGNSATGSGHG
jgi:hypothetical protein